MKFPILTAALLSAAMTIPAVCADAETWRPLGTGQLRDDLMTYFYVLPNYEFDVEIEESVENPGRYRLVNAYRNFPFKVATDFPADVNNYVVIDATDPVHVYIEQGGLSYYSREGVQLVMWSIADDYYHNIYGNWDKADEEAVCGKIVDGVITFPRTSLLVTGFEGDYFPGFEDDEPWTAVNTAGMFRVNLPGVPETDIAVSMIGLSGDGSEVKYDLQLDPDIESVKVAVFEGSFTDDMVTRIIDGSVESRTVTASGEVGVPYTADGFYTLVAVPYADGKIWPAVHFTREWAFSEAEWRKVGTGVYVDGIISGNEVYEYNNYFPTPYEYEVSVEQSVAEPWKIRLVDPYGPDSYPMATVNNYDTSKRYYMVFDFGKHDNVKLEQMNTVGLNIGSGWMVYWSIASRIDPQNEPEDWYLNFISEQYGDNIPTGHYNPDERVVTFDKNAFLIKFGANPTTWYAANTQAKARLALPAGVEIPENPSHGVDSPLDDVSGMEAEFYSLDGIRVKGTPAPGLYIMRRGNETRKVIVK